MKKCGSPTIQRDDETEEAINFRLETYMPKRLHSSIFIGKRDCSRALLPSVPRKRWKPSSAPRA
jgi:hypothetical protein